jgi:hypothetical protein
MGNKLTGDMGYTLDWANALEKCVANGTNRGIREHGRKRSIYRNGALCVEFAISRKTKPQVAAASWARWDGGPGGPQPSAEERDGPDGG